MKRKILLLLLLCLGAVARAQTGGIEGVVRDNNGEPLLMASVEVTQGGILKSAGATDIDGKFLIKPLNTGKYNVKVSFPEYCGTEIIQDVIVENKGETHLHIILPLLKITGPTTKFHVPKESSINVSIYEKPLIDQNRYR